MSTTANNNSTSIGEGEKRVPTKNAHKWVLDHYFHEYTCELPPPLPPKVPLLYRPRTLETVFVPGEQRAIYEADVEAMVDGMEKELRAVYYLTQPQHVRQGMELVSSGQAPELSETDKRLIDIDFDESPLRQRPSLALLQRPLYTEIGIIPKEMRALTRANKLLKEEDEAEQEGDDGAASRGASGAMTAPAQQAGGGGGDTTAMSRSEWTKQVVRSFKRASIVDHCFQKMLDNICKTSLLLGRDVETRSHTKKLLGLIHKVTPASLHAELWSSVKQFASGETEAAQFRRVLHQQGVQLDLIELFERWAADHELLQEQFPAASSEDAGGKSPCVDNKFCLAPERGSGGDDPEAQPLRHPKNPSAVPCSILPVLPALEEERGAGSMRVAAQGNGLAQFVFIGSAPRTFAPNSAPSMLLGNDLLLPPPQSKELAVEGGTTWYSSLSHFESFRTERQSTKAVVLHFGEDAVRYCAVDRSDEFTRQVARPPQGTELIVSWDGENDLPHPKKRRTTL